jgi:hygromycin-B 7''-O-kinase
MSLPQGPAAAAEAAWDALLADDAALASGVATLCARHGLGALPVLRYDSGSMPVYAIGAGHVLKLFPPQEGSYASIEARTLNAVIGALPIPTPRLLAHDSLDGWHCLLMTQLHGRRLVDVWPDLSLAQRERMADELSVAVAALHTIDTAPLADFTPRWEEFMRAQHEGAVERQRARRLDPYWLERLPDFLQRWMPPPDARRSLLHTELMREHLLVEAHDGGWRLSGLFDFEPAMVGAPEYDFASFGLFVSCSDGRFLRRALLAYGYRADELDAALQCRLMAYAMLHRYSNLRWYLERMPADGAASFEALAARWWALS